MPLFSIRLQVALALACLVPVAVAQKTTERKKTDAPTVQTALGQDLRPETPQQMRDRQLTASVEKAYASGVENYRAGRLAEARLDFDHAVDLMLSSGVDLKQDEVLSEEFERIVDAVNSLEMAALKEGNGFSPKVEATPADVADEATFTNLNPQVKATAQAELATTQAASDLPLVINDYVATFINFFSTSPRGRATLQHSLQRAGRYKAMIQKVLAEEGVPQDLIYQAVAESGFQPQVVNARSGAGGMWQFMPNDSYGLLRNGYVDERFDPIKSTHGYARYIKQLYAQLGDWYLAMAAYDWGPGNVQRAVQRTGYADFWELYKRNNLPLETKNYVPEIIAATIIAKNPKQYGFEGLALDNPVIADTVATDYSVDLRLVSDVTGVSVEELVELNPSLLRLVTPPDTSFDLHLPPGRGQLYEQRIAAVPEDKRRLWRYHRVASGDTLRSVAVAYHVSPADLASTNQLEEEAALAGVDALVVPVAPVAAKRATTYMVRKGDTLITVSDRFGVPVENLRRWNGLKPGAALRSGKAIRVVEPARVTHAQQGSLSKKKRASTKSASKRRK